MKQKRTLAPVPTETENQLTVVAYFRAMQFGINDGVKWTHIRGERASASDGIRAKKMGVNRAFPDFAFIKLWKYNSNAVLIGRAPTHDWIEMKALGWRDKLARNNNPTVHEAEQLEMINFLRACGDRVEICETPDEVKETLWAWGYPLRRESHMIEAMRKSLAECGV